MLKYINNYLPLTAREVKHNKVFLNHSKISRFNENDPIILYHQ